jgi:hypothetical protein
MASRQADVTPGHFEWLVDGRSANQRSTLELYRIIHDNSRTLNKNAELQQAAQKLTSIAFSLWRAVFLSDTTGEFEDEWADLNKFLVSLISDNTVLYVTDKNARNWSFHYYLENADQRLLELSKSRLALVDSREADAAADTDKDAWLQAQALLEKAIDRLATAVAAAG